MKTKKNKKKLELNKISIAQLDKDKMKQVKTGDFHEQDQTEQSYGNHASGCGNLAP